MCALSREDVKSIMTKFIFRIFSEKKLNTLLGSFLWGYLKISEIEYIALYVLTYIKKWSFESTKLFQCLLLNLKYDYQNGG